MNDNMPMTEGPLYTASQERQKKAFHDSCTAQAACPSYARQTFRDTLQEIIAVIKQSDFGIDMQFTNYRSN